MRKSSIFQSKTVKDLESFKRLLFLFLILTDYVQIVS